MESHNRHPQPVGTNQGEEEDHQDKSVLTKVKDKAKKMRNKFSKHGGGHEQDHHDPDEEDDKDGLTTRATGQGDSPKVPMAEFGDTKAAVNPKVPHLEKTDPKKDSVPAASQHTKQIPSTQPGVTPMPDEALKPRPNYHASTTESLVGHDQVPSPQPKVDFGKTSVKGEAPHAPQNTPLPALGEYKSKGADPSPTFVSGKEGRLGQSREQTPVSSLGRDDQKTNVSDTKPTSVTGKEGNSGQTRGPLHNRGLDERTPISSRGDQKTNVTDPSHTSATGNEGHFGQSEVNLDRPRGLEKDPNAQTKVTNPTNAGGDEVGIAGIHRSLDKMNINAGDTKPSNQGSSYTEKVSSAAFAAKNALASTLGYGGGNNDQREDVNPHADSPGKDSSKSGLHHDVGTNQNLGTGSHDQFCAEHPPNQGGSYTERVSTATSAVAGNAVSAKNAVASKLGYGGGNNDQHEVVKPQASSDQTTGTGQNLSTPENPSNQGSYTGKISSATNAIGGTAISAKNVAASKLGYGGGNNDQHEFVKPQASSNQTTGTGQNLSTPENPSNQGSYAGKISSATNAIAGTAISAKNVAASKLGYGGETDQQQRGDHAAVGSGSAAPEQQGKGITAKVTEKPTPVYEKAAGAGSALKSELPVSTGTAGKEEVHQGTATSRGEYDKAGKDQGVSAKGYLSEKLKPGEEDRALSEVISETLRERKAEQPVSAARPVGKVTETKKAARPVGKVTETAEVTEQLGPDYGPEDVQQSSYGKVVADTFKGAVGSLFGKADQTAASPESLGSPTGKEGFSSSGTGAAERRGRVDGSGK